MDIIHSMNGFLPRQIAHSLDRCLRTMPAVVVTGARQTGKSTLAGELASRKRRYVSLDDLDALDAARRDPLALVGGEKPVTLDEVQRTPDLLAAVKREIDRRRRPGQFLLTGSANLLLMRQVAETLAGRASYLSLWPMSRREQLGTGACGVWEQLLAAPDASWPDIVTQDTGVGPESWQALGRRGGFPFPAVHLGTHEERAIWFDGYIQTYLERDLLQLSSVAALPDFRRLMRAACLRIGQTMNQTELGRDVALPQTTVHRYLNLLETSCLLVRVPAYAVNRTKRLMKAPKLYWSDTGVALRLTGGEPTGGVLENLVLNDLLVWRDSRLQRAEILHWRTAAGEEVDFVIETDHGLLPIEVKAGRRPGLGDARHLRTFRSEYPGRVRAGLLLHAGDATEWLAPDVLATPWWRVV